ncbi:TetR/AcrR family transcriptional regulator [Citricoccus sp. NPDC055426]|uniref:TetR/AcrR family transcriptional regulator n=1 Tax=Citricoccus sp. NPDC055426 TaxID=3155536 RepID=UPI003420F89C
MGDDTTEGGLPRAVAAAWGLLQTPQRGPARGLDHQRIAEAGVVIADRDGLAAVTMAAVARELGFTTMSLYRYVGSKDELLRLMQNAAVQIPDGLVLPASWPEGIRTWAEVVRRAYRARPWLMDLPRDQAAVLMPNTLRAAELGLATMDGLDLEDGEKIGIILLVSQHVMSLVELERSLAVEGGVSMTPEGLERLGTVVTAERFPRLAALISTGGFADPPPADPVGDDGEHGDDSEHGVGGAGGAGGAGGQDPADVEMEYTLGLDLITAGIDALIARRAAGPTASGSAGASGTG